MVTLFLQMRLICSSLACFVLYATCRIKGHLGSGQFGNVRKGVWQTSTEEMINVAVKCLAEGSTERERIKFLQEAAIMGQFKHPNIVSIFGIVTTSEPVRNYYDFDFTLGYRNHVCIEQGCFNYVSLYIY